MQSIAEQARQYVGAIESSITAAQQGYDIADKALQLSDILKGPKCNAEERDIFAREMVTHATAAHLKASKAVTRFRACRQAILPVGV